MNKQNKSEFESSKIYLLLCWIILGFRIIFLRGRKSDK